MKYQVVMGFAGDDFTRSEHDDLREALDMVAEQRRLVAAGGYDTYVYLANEKGERLPEGAAEGA